MERRTTAAIATAALLAACGPEWPSRVTSVAEPRSAAVRSIDILPVDLQLWTDEGLQADTIREDAADTLLNTVAATLGTRHIAVPAVLNNTYMTQSGLQATLEALAQYGAVADADLSLPAPYLPVHLGDATGADATLYIGGWGYVAVPHTSTGEKVAEGVVIAIAVIAVVALIVVLAKGHGGGGGGGGGHVASGAASAGHGFAGRMGGAGHIGSLSPGHVSIPGRGGDAYQHRRQHSGGGADVAEVIDLLPDPDVPAVDATPPQPPTALGDESMMDVQMTLVDNHTGLALWHAHQRFPADANHPGDVARVARTLLAALPRQ